MEFAEKKILKNCELKSSMKLVAVWFCNSLMSGKKPSAGLRAGWSLTILTKLWIVITWNPYGGRSSKFTTRDLFTKAVAYYCIVRVVRHRFPTLKSPWIIVIRKLRKKQ